MRKSRLGSAGHFLLACTTALAGCSSAAGRHGSLPPLETSWQAPAPSGAIGWRYHPKQAATQRAVLPAEDGRVVAGDRGERWWLPDVGVPASAAMLAPEPLVGIVRPKDDAFWFLGASGTVYRAKSPVGPFSSASAPPRALVRVTGAQAGLWGVSEAGKLLRSLNGGVVWNELTVGQGQRFVDVAADNSGRLVALSVPEQLWWAKSPEAALVPLAAPTVGARELSSRGSELVVRGLFGDHTITAAGQLERAVASAASVPSITPPPGPDARAVLELRAALSDGNYWEARRASAGFELLHGKLGQPLRSLPLGALGACATVKLAASGARLAAACSAKSGTQGSEVWSLFLSQDAGEHWHREPYMLYGSERQLRLALGPEGQLLLSGVCRAERVAEACQPQGIYVRQHHATRGPAEAASLRPAVVPGLNGPAQLLIFASSSSHAYALGTRSKAGELGLFVSKDGGSKFEALALPGPKRARRSAELGRPLRAVAGQSGVVALNFERGILVFNEGGTLLGRSSPPEGSSFFAGAGTRAIAWSEGTQQLQITHDAGGSFAPLGPLPAPLCEPARRCSPDVACDEAGCIFADSLSRAGWEPGPEPSRPWLAPPPSGPAFVPERRTRIPISCDLQPGGFTALEYAVDAPTARESAMGAVDWFVPAENVARQGAFLWHLRDGRLERLTLFAENAQPARFASLSTRQVEGMASLRYPLAEPSAPRLRQLELAWVDYFASPTVQRAKLADAGPYMPGDYEPLRNLPELQRANPDLLSIARGGIFLRPHRAPRQAQTTYFLDGRTVREIPPAPFAEVKLEPQYFEMVATADGPLPLLLAAGGAIVAQAAQGADGTWQFSARTVGLLSPLAFQLAQGTGILYSRSGASAYVQWGDAYGTEAVAFAVPFSRPGLQSDPIALPTQLNLANPPQACSAEARRNTPRTVSLFSGGTRHPVLITEGTEPLRVLLTSSAVLHGSPEAPCAAMLDAEPAVDTPGATQRETALIAVDDPRRSFLFRLSTTQASGPLKLEYRAMSCRFDSGAEVPEEVFRAIGTHAAPTGAPAGSAP